MTRSDDVGILTLLYLQLLSARAAVPEADGGELYPWLQVRAQMCLTHLRQRQFGFSVGVQSLYTANARTEARN